MGEATGMEAQHPGVDIVATEEIAGVVEDHFVVVVVVVEERHFERAGVGFEWTWREGADHEALRQKSGVRRGRQVIAMAHDGSDILDVDATDAQIPVPARGIERIEGKGRNRDLATALDAHPPFPLVLLRAKRRVHLRHVEHGRIEQCVRAEQALVGQHERAVARFDQQQRRARGACQPPHRAPRQYQVVTGGKTKVAKVAVQLAATAMHEQQLVTIGVARQMIHAARELPVTQLAMRVAENNRRVPGRSRAALELGQVEGVWPEWSLESGPAGGRVAVIEKTRRPEEPFLAHLALEAALGQVGVRLAAGDALDAREPDVILHPGLTPGRPRRAAAAAPRAGRPPWRCTPHRCG
jgi:hypothetical protein